MFRGNRGPQQPLTELISLKGKRALVTGAAAGIGKAIAYRFAEAGAALELVDIDEGGLATVKAELQSLRASVATHKVDLSLPHEIHALWQRLRGREPDILVNNAGIYPMRDFLEVDAAFLHKVEEINLNSVFWMCQHMVRSRKGKGGVIINVGSIEAIVPFKDDLVHYGLTKAGVVALTRNLAKEYGKEFRVNCLLPGGIMTSGTRSVATGILKGDLGIIKDGLDFWARLPIGRMGRPDEVACMALVLASGLSSYMLGALVAVDGGFLSA